MSYKPNSAAARDVAYLIHPYTNFEAHESQGPMIIERGEGIYVFDDQGRRYIEGLAGLWCAGLGFSEKRLVKAAHRQLDTLPYAHTFAHRSCQTVIDLAEKLISVAPEPMSKAFFCCSGSEAIDSAIKFAWYYNNALGRPEKKKVITRERAYHGVTIAGGAMTRLAYVQEGFDLPQSHVRHTDAPCYYRNAEAGESEEEFSRRMVDNLEQLIVDEGPETIAAFFAEPVMGAGGVITPPEGYFKGVQAVLRKHDILFVADEVICGLGRTGNMWGCETYDLRPDMITCAKQLSSAYMPVAAVLVSQKVYEAFRDFSARLGTFGTGFTYSGHPVGSSVALETLKIYESDDIVGHVRAVAPRFLERLRALEASPLVGEARGIGLIGGLEVVADKATREQFAPERKVSHQVTAKALEEGLMVRPLTGDVVAVCPPLIITEAEIDDLFDRLTRAFERTAAEV
jgi:4-aminobutyrate--pyruvate transaminase